MPGGPVLGIDMGTRYALAAVHCAGKGARLIPNRRGQMKTPSVVCRDSGQWLVGEDALARAQVSGVGVFWDIKRHLGCDWAPWIDGRHRSAQELLVPLIAAVREDCEAHLSMVLTRCVITVPAQFSFLERSAMARVAREAGFEDIRILNEPTAAALACESAGRVLVFDFGGGTVDLSIVERDGQTWQVLESRGDAKLGGVELDRVLSRYLQDQLGLSLDLGSPLEIVLLNEAERIKCDLSFREKLTWRFPVQLEGQDREISVRRDMIETLFVPWLQKSVDLAVSLCRYYEPESVIMVGGSSRIPLLRRLLSQKIPVPVRLWRSPDEAVALGAALYGNNGDGQLLLDVLSESLGIIAFDGQPVPLLRKGHPLPARSVRAFRSVTDGDFSLKLYQGAPGLVRRYRTIAVLDLQNMRCGERVDLDFRIDAGGLLQVHLAREAGDPISIAPLELGVSGRRRPATSLEVLERRVAALASGLSLGQQGRLANLFRKTRLLRDLEPQFFDEGMKGLSRMVDALEETIYS